MKKTNTSWVSLKRSRYYLLCCLLLCGVIPNLALAWGSCSGNAVSLENAFGDTANFSGLTGNMSGSATSGTVHANSTLPLGNMAAGCSSNACYVSIASITVDKCTYTNLTINMDSSFGTCQITNLSATVNDNACRYKQSTTDVEIEIYRQE